jgi:hypothetical protein
MRKRTRTTRIQQHTCAGAVDEEEVEKEVVTTSRFMQSCKTSEGDGSSLQACNSGVGPITRDPYPSRITWICTTGPWGISIEGLLY